MGKYLSRTVVLHRGDFVHRTLVIETLWVVITGEMGADIPGIEWLEAKNTGKTHTHVRRIIQSQMATVPRLGNPGPCLAV